MGKLSALISCLLLTVGAVMAQTGTHCVNKYYNNVVRESVLQLIIWEQVSGYLKAATNNIFTIGQPAHFIFPTVQNPKIQFHETETKQ